MSFTAVSGAVHLMAATVFALFNFSRVFPLQGISQLRVVSGEGAHRLRVNVISLELFDPFALGLPISVKCLYHLKGQQSR